MSGLEIAYGDAAASAGGHVDLDVIAATVWDPATEPQVARADFLNQITHASDSWISQPELAGRLDATKIIADRDVIVLGFDGSRSQGVTDATALIGCRVSDGHLFEVGVWQQPEGPSGVEWRVPVSEVEAAVAQAFQRWNVVGMYCDPARWESYVAGWEARYAPKLKVRASREHPCEWWMTGGRSTAVVRALEQFHSAIVDGECTYDGSFALTRHILNARRRPSRSGMQVAKDFPDSPRKIDAAIAATLAWQARLDALGKGIGSKPAGGFVPVRVR
jgi:hypothetical protein